MFEPVFKKYYVYVYQVALQSLLLDWATPSTSPPYFDFITFSFSAFLPAMGVGFSVACTGGDLYSIPEKINILSTLSPSFLWAILHSTF